ncbi:formate dehydrogenase accessory sulfurtransferase FdhD [Marinobacter sp. M216]|uniref:Sulfur carrier protein FdhD n=1 Tax=Marinobacter albus TaxID=3030833 RepID=A0ABT7HEN4_9GAMM|nr:MULTISPECIES: formate dehydrogenase accessory sulfurtransferase FdhD [unclassified Marinobacter]MBW7471884.1 formate dehydrogenase accessory sulfurtransferase FdhD [Marinobacter sp. F4218]MDK9558454.1 formate dehydrogenase accessory sulfurtransferase FdhD [Marinobacter sp. M216]
MPRHSSSPVIVHPLDSHQALPAAVSSAPVEGRGGIKGAATGQDAVAEEVPVAMVYNGVSHAVMMASPSDLEDFALGFSLSEGILDRAEQLFDLDIQVTGDGVSVEMRIAGDRFTRLREQRRNLTGRTGCGLCGTESLAHAVRPIPSVPPWPVPVDAVVQAALAQLKEHQALQAQTGATHGAAWCDATGRILQAREDVGRHNALDKLIGARMRRYGADAFDDGFVLISSRASFEMVQKSACVGISCLVAVSAATALAIREARTANMTLIGFARPGRHVIYNRGDAPACEETSE